MASDIAEVVASVKKRTAEVEERKELQRQARLAKARAKELKAQQEAQEKMVAPILLFGTIAISLVVLLVQRFL